MHTTAHAASRSYFALFVILAVGGCRSPVSVRNQAVTGGASAPRPDTAAADPTKNEVVLGTRADWRATLVLDQGDVGIWTVQAHKVFPQFGCPEIVGLDDKGRCHVMWSYSGKWTPATTIADGVWLGGIAQADIDPRIDGPELYVGAKSGNVYQVVSYPDGGLDHRRIATLDRREVHTLVAAEVLADRPGDELLAFTSPGGLYLLVPRTDGHDGFAVHARFDIPGRVRDAVVLPKRSGRATEIATVSRAGTLDILDFDKGVPRWTMVHTLAMGRGRVALRPSSREELLVLYSTADDGTIWRHERGAADRWRNELIYAGPQGPRGIAAGRFDPDPSVETIVVFGYSERVELLKRSGDVWTTETLFEDRDKGHWIAACEVDGRNATDEIVCSGYGGRIVLLSRLPGVGLDRVLSDTPRDEDVRP